MKFSHEALARLRQEKSYTLGMLSRLMKSRAGCQVSRSAIHQWERGITLPRLEGLVALCKVFEVGPEVFFIREANKQFVKNTRQGGIQ